MIISGKETDLIKKQIREIAHMFATIATSHFLNYALVVEGSALSFCLSDGVISKMLSCLSEAKSLCWWCNSRQFECHNFFDRRWSEWCANDSTRSCWGWNQWEWRNASCDVFWLFDCSIPFSSTIVACSWENELQTIVSCCLVFVLPKFHLHPVLVFGYGLDVGMQSNLSRCHDGSHNLDSLKAVSIFRQPSGAERTRK